MTSDERRHAARRLLCRAAALSQSRAHLDAYGDAFATMSPPEHGLARSTRARAQETAARLDEARRELVTLRHARVTCGARCRDGHACNAPGIGRGGRCKLHGGCSTGPVSAEGRTRALDALARGREAVASKRAMSSTAG